MLGIALQRGAALFEIRSLQLVFALPICYLLACFVSGWVYDLLYHCHNMLILISTH